MYEVAIALTLDAAHTESGFSLKLLDMKSVLVLSPSAIQ